MTGSKILLLNAEQVIEFNKYIVGKEKQVYQCLDRGKIESALSSAFYPGNCPFQYGGVAKIAGAVCFFLAKAHGFLDGNKRTAGIASVTFMIINNYDLKYPIDHKQEYNEFAFMIEELVKNKISKEDILSWFDLHKVQKKNDHSFLSK